MLGFDTSRASSDDRGCPAAELCGGFSCCNMIPLSLTGNGWTDGVFNLQAWPPSAGSAKHNLRAWGWKGNFLLGTSALT